MTNSSRVTDRRSLVDIFLVVNYMKCNNYFIFSVGITALCHFAFFTQIVPCNVRLKFNKLIGDTMTFEAPGGPYT